MNRIKDSDKTSRDIRKAFETGKYIVTYRSIYQPYYSQAQQQFYAMEVYRAQKPLTLPGRFFHFTGDQVNHLLGHALFNNL